jgi:hypothetical protein
VARGEPNGGDYVLQAIATNWRRLFQRERERCAAKIAENGAVFRSRRRDPRRYVGAVA